MSVFAPRRVSPWWWLPAAAVLFHIGSWTPDVPSPLPAAYAQPVDMQALTSLPADTPFLLTATVQVTADTVGTSWQGREVFLHRAQRDLGGRGTSRHIVVETIAQRRPSLQLHWNDGVIAVAADSYRLDFAPRIEPRWNDAWDRSSRGFRNGDTALALGRTGPGGRYWVESLLQAPLSSVHEDIRHGQRPRQRLTLAAQLAASLVIVALLVAPRPARGRPPTITG